MLSLPFVVVGCSKGSVAFTFITKILRPLYSNLLALKISMCFRFRWNGSDCRWHKGSADSFLVQITSRLRSFIHRESGIFGLFLSSSSAYITDQSRLHEHMHLWWCFYQGFCIARDACIWKWMQDKREYDSLVKQSSTTS